MIPNVGNLYGDLRKCAQIPGTDKSFWCIVDILTYSRAWNFVTGPRSCGKTTGVALFLLLDFVRNGRQFIYTRRTKDELDLTKSKFFSDAIKILKDKLGLNITEFYMEGFDYYIGLDGEEAQLCGTSYYISKEEKLKSGGIFVYNAVYDEFISQDSTGYLGTLDAPKEYEKVLELFATLDRTVGVPYRNEVRFFFLGNTATIYNPIFTELNIVQYIQDTSKIIAPKNEAWLLQQLHLEDVRALEDFKDSNLFKLSTDKQKDYNFNNKGRDSEVFIETKPENSKLYCIFKIQGKEHGLYLFDGILYLSRAQHATSVHVYSLDIDSHDGVIDKEYVHRYGNNEYIKITMDAYKQGRLRFQNGQVKNTFMKYFGFLPT